MKINSKLTKKSLDTIEKIVGSKLTLGKLLWAIRNADEINTTQAKFAEKLGISKQHLCDIEQGRKLVSPRLAAIYAKKLGYSQEQFIRLALQDIVDRDKLNVEVEIHRKVA